MGHGSDDAGGALDLLVVRHGNTFAPGDVVTWVGRNEDLPLVAKGLAQAEALGSALAAARWRPDRALASRLRRTRGHLERALLVAGASDVPVETDPRLDEIDYGPWGGLSSEAIAARGDGDALEAWSRDLRWPAAFAEREQDVRARVLALAHELARDAALLPRRELRRALVVSSNGVMRYLLELAPGALAARRRDGTFKVGTGRACRLAHAAGAWRVLAWDAPVETLDLAGVTAP